MTEVSPPFAIPVPQKFKEDTEVQAWVNNLNRFLNELFVRTGGGTDTVASTETLALSATEKTDLITISQAVDLDTVESDLASTKSTVDTAFTGSPTYVPTNDGTDRAWDANQAAGAITSPPTQAEVENIRDALLELSDVVATMARDMAAKGLTGV